MLEYIQENRCNFTPDQEQIYKVLSAIINNVPFCVFIDARRGCGKTLLLNTILASVRSLKEDECVALAITTNSIAANHLKPGRTFQSRLKSPLTPNEE